MECVYTLINRATFLRPYGEIKLAILVEKDGDLLNFITPIPVNPAKVPRVDAGRRGEGATGHKNEALRRKPV